MTPKIYLALGDSITAGHGVTHPSLAFVRHVSDFAQKQLLADRTVVIAKNGWTTKDILTAANRISPGIWQQTSLLTLMSGGNDLRKLLRRQYLSLSGQPISPTSVYKRLQEFGYHMDALCAHIAEQRIPHVIVATVYNPIPNFPLAVRAIDALNGIAREIAEHYDFTVVNVQKKFLTHEAYYIEGYKTGRFEDLMSPIRRPIHPNNAGHKRIADTITEHLARDLATKTKRPRKKKRHATKTRI
ncbi:SGNH/GDSL hydrolase family protein [Alicyclobacillus sp. SO9]|uniref:SGNH/GDSL hydrolase family protein n=1 Tax=Alicyclobacillus sp. SO9 TaxID=2665646 RepID=UPI0018E8DF14|nr:SGNH/GDSL hydrolase family protein [Alicyclobacillus sp. SO9]QQE78292.1 SGNH/GDSL hydrolase family protein [Alicyclobacillus sp. SO9]